MLGLDGDLDPLIRRERPARAPCPSPWPTPVAALDAPSSSWPGAPEGRYPDLDAARRQQRSARETLSILREAAERARREHADAAAALRRARLAVDEANGRAGGSDEAARLLDDVLFDPPDAPSTSAPAASRDELIARQDDVATRLAHVEQGLAELSALDMRPIEVLVDAIRNPAPARWCRPSGPTSWPTSSSRSSSRSTSSKPGSKLRAAAPPPGSRPLEAARAELAAAERAMQKPNLSPDDVTELEAGPRRRARGRVQVFGRLRRGGSKKLDEAAAAQQAILDRVGFPTWSSYVMGAGLLGIDPMAEERLERARLDLDAAEAHWAEVAASIEADPDHRALLDRLEAVYLEAFDILGGDDEQADLEHALRAVQVPKREVTQDELVEALAYQLEIVGLALGPEPGIDRVLMAADAFLAEVSALAVRIGELNAERDELQVEMSDARHAVDTFDAAERAAAEPTIDLTDGAADISRCRIA